MKKIPNEIYSYLSSIQRVEFFEEQIILYTKEGIYVYIPVSASKDIYSYLKELAYDEISYPLNSFAESFQLFFVSKRNKERLFILENLYLKSSKTVSFDEQTILKIYHKCLQNFHRQNQFYFDVQNRIEEMYYPRKPFYNLLIHISDIYHLLSLGEFFLQEWFQLKPIEYKEVFTLRRIDSNNFWDDKILDVSQSRRDYYIYELANYYRMYHEEDSIVDEINDFFHHFSTTQEDICLFYALISSVEEFDWEGFDSEEKLVSYVSKTYSFVLEKYKEYQENKEKMLKEK